MGTLSRRKPEAAKHLKYNLMLIHPISPAERGARACMTCQHWLEG
ncbi:MAG: hypothetical protein ACPK85_12775 [Methanosarcina sp.]